MSQNIIPQVFIFYSWLSSDRVLALAERLTSDGVMVIFDKWELKEGQDKYSFMEQAVNNTDVSKVLMICDKSYAEKANNRKGGVGDETLIISPEIYSNVEQEKFIPIIFEKDEKGKPYCPTYIKSRIHIDLSTDDEAYETSYEQLLRNLHEKPLYRKPALGKMPEWLENESVNYAPIRTLIAQVKRSNDENKKKIPFLFKQFNAEFITALNALPVKEGIPHDEALILQIDEEKTLRDLFLDFLEASIHKDLPIEDMITSFFEEVYNAEHAATGGYRSDNSKFDIYRFTLWELFICMTAMLLYYEQYEALNTILTHNYFLMKQMNINGEYRTYTRFDCHIETIEEIYKPKSEYKNNYTLTGKILIEREKKPIVTKENLVNADIVLCQMLYALNLAAEYDLWFARSYVYHEGTQAIWYKLQSKKYCEKIMPLFNVQTIEKLKESISRCQYNRDLRYSGSGKFLPTIIDSINLAKIGSIN